MGGGWGWRGAKLRCWISSPAQSLWPSCAVGSKHLSLPTLISGIKEPITGHVAFWVVDGDKQASAVAGSDVDMSAFGRPNAKRSVVGPSTISVSFPDDKTYMGQIQP